MTYRSSAPRSGVPLTVALTLVGVFCAGVGLGQLPGLPSLKSLRDAGTGADTGQLMLRSAPTRISIPSLGVRATVVEVGLASDGGIAAPSTDPVATTGWYGHGPAPGEPGTAVIVGHVDTQTRPAVFHSLRELRQGKVIEVTRRDDQVVEFRVDAVRNFPKMSFPADQIFAIAGRPRLVLVTCGGPWIGGTIGYADNVIVFATLS